MTLAVVDSRYEEALRKSEALSRTRGTTDSAFIKWMAGRLAKGQQILYTYGEPESDGDLLEVSTSAGPMLVVYLPDLRKARVSEKWISRGRGSKKTTAHVSRVTHSLTKQKPVPVLPGRRAAFTEVTSPERHAEIDRSIAEAVKDIKPKLTVVAKKPSAKPKGPVNLSGLLHKEPVTAPSKPTDWAQHKAPAALAAAGPKAAAPSRPGANKPQYSAGGKQFRIHQKTNTAYEVHPGEYWVTVTDPGHANFGHAVLIREIPGHPGEGVTLTPFGGGIERGIPVTTVKTEQALADAAKRRSERQDARREAAMTKTKYTQRNEQEKLAERNTKTARMADVVAARLSTFGHSSHGFCKNTDAGEKGCAAASRNGAVHLLTPEQIQASRAEGEKPLSENAVSLRWKANVNAQGRFVRMLGKHFTRYGQKVANLPTLMSDDPEALSRFIDKEREERARNHIMAAEHIGQTVTKTEAKLKVAVEELKRVEQVAAKDTEPIPVTCPQCFGNGKDGAKPCILCKGTGEVTREEERVYEAREKVADLETSVATLKESRQQHEHLAALDTAEMPPLVMAPPETRLKPKRQRQPEWRKQAATGVGDAEEWAAAKPDIAAALAERKAHWAAQVIYLDNEIADTEFGRRIDDKSQIPPHIQRREASRGLRVLLGHAKEVDKAFLAAQSALSGDDITKARKAVDFAFLQEQRQPESAISGARIKGAAPGHRPKFQDVPEGKPKLGRIDPARLAEMAKKDALLEREMTRLEGLYEPKNAGVTDADEDTISSDQRLPATPNYVEPMTPEQQTAAWKTFVRDNLTSLVNESVTRAYAPVEAEDILGLSGRGKEEEKILADARSEGLFAAVHSVALGMTRGAMMDRRTVTMLGPVASTMAMRSFIDQHDPEKVVEAKKYLYDWVLKNTLPRLASAKEMYQSLVMDARNAQAAMKRKQDAYARSPEEPTRGPQASEMVYEQREMYERAVSAIRHISSVWSEVQAANVMLRTMRLPPPAEIPVQVPSNVGFERKDLTEALQHYGLKPVVDYRIETVNEQPVVNVKYSALSKFVRPRQPLIDPALAEKLEALQEGDESSVIHGFVPAGFRTVTHTPADAFEVAHAAEVLSNITSVKDLDEKVQDAIGTLSMYGLSHRQVRSLLHDEKMEERILPAFRATYAAMVERHLPSGDYEADRRSAAKAHTLINRVVDKLRSQRGMPATSADQQRLDEMAASSHLDSALKVVPFGHVAYKNVNELTGTERDVLRRFWADEIAGVPYVPDKGENDKGRQAWGAFLKHAGGETEALAAAQDLLKDELIGQYLYHSTASQVKTTPEGTKPTGVSPKVAQVPIRHADKMDRSEFTGPRAGLLNRRSLGAVAEQQLERMLRPKGELASRYDVKQRPVTALPGRLDMESPQWRHQQMAIRAFPIAKRQAIVTDTGTGKTVIALGGLTEVMAEGNVKRSVWMVPRSVIENYKLQGDLVRFTHNGSGLKWFARAGASAADRRSAMRDPNYNLYITTPESMREDLLDMVDEHFRDLDAPSTEAQKRGMAAPKTPEQARQRRDIMLRRLGELPEEQRSSIVHAALKKAGVQFEHAFLDEAHRLSERSGKATSQMTMLDTALTDGLPYFMLATASPAQNDMSEATDLTRKVRPDLFVQKKGEEASPYQWLWQNYGSLGMSATREETARKPARDPDPLLLQALRREIAPLVFMATAEDENRPNYSEQAVNLTAGQMDALQKVQQASGKAYRIDTQEGRNALRFLNPEAFRRQVKQADGSTQTVEVPPGSTEEFKVASNQVQALETLRREAVQHVLHDLPIAMNAKTQHLARTLRTGKHINKRTGLPSSGLIFTNRVEAATQVANDLNDVAKKEGWKGFKAYALDFTTSPSKVKEAEDDYADSMKAGRQVVLVASPAHSEAKDYPGGQWVKHFDLPHTLHAMNQREGRLRAAINKNGELHSERLVAHYQDKGQSHKHEAELASEQVLRGKAPLMRLFRRHRGVGSGDDLTRMFAANRLLKTTT